MRPKIPNEKTEHGLTDSWIIEQIEKERKEKRETKRFWIPVVISLIALIISLISLWLQSKN